MPYINMTPIPFEVKPNKYHKMILFVIIVLISVSTYSTVNNILAKEKDVSKVKETSENFKMIAEIEVKKPDGTTVKQCVDDDIILRNYAYLLNEMFDGSNAVDREYTCTDGVTRTIRYDSGDPYILFRKERSRIYVGTDSTTPTITDYALGSSITYEDVTGHIIQSNGNEFNMSIVTVWNPSSSYNVREMGLTTSRNNPSDSNVYDVMICRDVFSSISVENGDTVTLRYVWVFNEGA